MQEVLDRHYTISDSIQTSLDDDSESIAEMIQRLGGIQLTAAKNIGLRFFVANKAELIEYDIISQLSDIESTTDILEKKMDNLLDFSYSILDKTDQVNKTKLLIHLSNVIDSEQNLLELYATFLDKNVTYLAQ